MSTASSGTLAYLVRLSTDMGTPTNYQYTSSQADVVHSSLGTFTPALIDAEFKDLSGRADNETITIEMDARAPLINYGAYPSHAPIDATIWIVDLSDVDNTAELLWTGRMTVLEVNPDKRKNVYRLTVAGPKWGYEETPCGAICLSTCIWGFGGAMCLKDVDALEETDTVASIDGLVVTLTTGLTTGSFDRWLRGHLRIGGLALAITETITDGIEFRLLRQPPSVWVGATVTARPGCPKTLAGCRLWSNEARFAALGYAMPDADPRTRSI